VSIFDTKFPRTHRSHSSAPCIQMPIITSPRVIAFHHSTAVHRLHPPRHTNKTDNPRAVNKSRSPPPHTISVVLPSAECRKPCSCRLNCCMRASPLSVLRSRQNLHFYGGPHDRSSIPPGRDTRTRGGPHAPPHPSNNI
jgi:hypothetical protein